MEKNKQDYLIEKLDLQGYLDEYSSYLSRERNVFLNGDNAMHLRYIKELYAYEFTPPVNIPSTQNEVLLLKKHSILKLSQITPFMQIVRYLRYLKGLNFAGLMRQWCDDIRVPEEISEIERYFDERYDLYDHINSDLQSVNEQIREVRNKVQRAFYSVLGKNSLQPFLLDTQIHFINQEETLLLRGGFHKVLPSKVVARSDGGFFYVIPYEISDIKHQLSRLLDTKDEIIYKIAQDISGVFAKQIGFLEYAGRAFDRFDSYQSRVFYAKYKQLEFMSCQQGSKIKLHDFSHPAIADSVPTQIDFSKNLLIVTGVNAGGKSVLLKSVLSAVFLAKYLLPMHINAHKSHIGSFANIFAIIEDPQSIEHNISTFAGRMLTFSKLFANKKNMLLGIDEIELGTDSDEAASLFQAILEEVIKKDNKIIVTTHHKKLASQMAKNPHTELLAAMYDEQNQKPTYRFLQGTIGKSYAFETAQRYGIPSYIVKKSVEYHGKDQENLSSIIQKSSQLESELYTKKTKLDGELDKIENIKDNLHREREKLELDYKQEKNKLHRELFEAIEAAKQAIKERNNQNAHKLLNVATKAQKISNERPSLEKKEKFTVGDAIMFNATYGEILAIQKDQALIVSENMRLKVPLKELKKANRKKKKQSVNLDIQKSTSASLTLDLHGVRAEEALDKLDKFLSNAAVNDLKEVIISHGMGSGRLAYLIKEALEIHPCILEYKNAPPNMGGYGATIAKLSLE